jgi:4-amino-4-deoxy-L-arabinose transferase-like glycosyltransferase
MSKRWILGLTAVGAVLRLVVGLSTLLHPSPELRLIQGDHFMAAGTYFLQNGYIPNPVFVPGYIYLCAFCQFLFPGHAVAALLVFQWMIATACIPLAMYLGQRLNGADTGVVFGALVALDPILIIQSSLILTEAVYIPLLLVAVVLFVASLAPEASVGRALLLLSLCGLTVGLCTLTRSVGLLVVPVMLLTLTINQGRSRTFRTAAYVVFLVPVLVILLPLCLQNQARYGHFNISSSGKFNVAALMIGPTKKAFDKGTSPELLDMWAQELGPEYTRKPPFVLADEASKVAIAWAEAHPVLTIKGIVKGELLMVIAPDRTSWNAALAWLNLSPLMLKGVYALISLTRLAIAVVVVGGMFGFRRLFRNPAFPGLFVLLILCHMAAPGAAGSGRFVAPVVPYIDLMAALVLVRFADGRTGGGSSLRSEGRELPLRGEGQCRDLSATRCALRSR